MSIPGLFEDELQCPTCGTLPEDCKMECCPMVPREPEWDRIKAMWSEYATEKAWTLKDAAATLWRRFT